MIVYNHGKETIYIATSRYTWVIGPNGRVDLSKTNLRKENPMAKAKTATKKTVTKKAKVKTKK